MALLIANIPFNPEEEETQQPQDPQEKRFPFLEGSRTILLLPMPDYIKDFEKWFNRKVFADLCFVFEDPDGHTRMLFTHKLVLSRNLPMRNYLLQHSSSTIYTPPGLNFSRFGGLLERFYHDGGAVNVFPATFLPFELAFITSLFGKIDRHGFLECKSLRQHLTSLMCARRFSDGILETEERGSRKVGMEKGEEEEGEEAMAIQIPIHRMILAARSDYFAHAFDNGLSESFSRKVRIPGVRSGEIGMLLLKFLYYHEEQSWLDPEVILEMLYAADHLQLQELKQMCVEEICRGIADATEESHFSRARGQVDAENVLGILEASFRLNIPQLRQACLSLAVGNFLKIQEQDEFVALSPELKKELSMLASLQNNPLNARAICCAREMLAMLKESLEIQQQRLDQVLDQYESKLKAFESEGISDPDVREGRKVFLRHWAGLIEAQERRVRVMRTYVSDHEKIFESVQF